MEIFTTHLPTKSNNLYLSTYIQLDRKVIDIPTEEIVGLIKNKLSPDKSYSILTTIEKEALKYYKHKSYFLHNILDLSNVISRIKEDDNYFNIGRIHFIEDTQEDKKILDILANMK